MTWEDRKMEDDGIGYHKRVIKKGELGKFSKVREEFEEMADAVEQGVTLMALVEASDLIGALEAWAQSNGMTLTDLIRMKDVTKRAFESGRRTSSPVGTDNEPSNRKPQVFPVANEIVLPESGTTMLIDLNIDRILYEASPTYQPKKLTLHDELFGSESDS